MSWQLHGTKPNRSCSRARTYVIGPILTVVCRNVPVVVSEAGARKRNKDTDNFLVTVGGES
jgi:hypothetical protein